MSILLAYPVYLQHRKIWKRLNFLNNEVEKETTKIISFLPFYLYFSIIILSILLHINCHFDYSEPIVFKQKIIKKEYKKSSQNNDLYILVFDTLGVPPNLPPRQTVERSIYAKYKINDHLTYCKKKGLLGIRSSYYEEL